MTPGSAAQDHQRGPRRRYARRAGLAAAAVGVLGLGVVAWSGSPAIAVPAEGPWIIGVAHPRGELGRCATDDSVAHAFMTADMPSSSMSVDFKPEATKDDVERVLRCLEDSLTAGDITFH